MVDLFTELILKMFFYEKDMGTNWALSCEWMRMDLPDRGGTKGVRPSLEIMKRYG